MEKNWVAITPDGDIHELSYVDLLNELQDMIDNDFAIPTCEREDIIETLASLMDMLWTHSN